MKATADRVLNNLAKEMEGLRAYARNDRFLPRSAEDGGADPEGQMLAARLDRALMNQMEDVRAWTHTVVREQPEENSRPSVSVAGSRFEIWATTVRDTIEQAARLVEEGRQEEAVAHLRAAANSVNAFGRFQREVEAEMQRLVYSSGQTR